MVDGFVAPGFEPVREAFAAHFDDQDELGAGFSVVVQGETKVELWGGYADRAKTRPWVRDTLVPVYSTSKPIAALVIAWLHGRGLIDLNDAIGEAWPAFSEHGKGAITVAQAMAHQAGVPGFSQPIDPDLWFDPPGVAAALAALEPMWVPGTAHGYHAVTYGVIVAELAQRASGRTLGHLLRDEICGPRGIDFFIGTPAREHARCAEIAKPKQAAKLGPHAEAVRAAFGTPWASPSRGGTVWREAELPGVNGHGTALSVAQLYQAFATGGKIAGQAVLVEEAYAALTAVQGRGQDLVLPFDLVWAAGVNRNSNGFYGPNPDAFGHAGWGGSCGFADPALGLSGSYVMNRQSHHLMADPRAVRLIEAVYRCV
jgi:CubicO group peptidase (beta-lactamase class C family)